jgi:hypothetical protein
MYATISSSGNVLAPPTRSYKYFFASPDLSSETNKLITKASAWLAWMMIQQNLHQQFRTGDKAAAIGGHLKCGLHQLAANAGCDIKTIRQQVRRLEKIGLIKILSKQPKLSVDAETGKLVRKGRFPRVEIILNIGDEHLKPHKKKPESIGGISDPSKESNRGIFPVSNMGNSDPYQRVKELNTEHPAENSYGTGISSDEKLAPPNKSISRISSAGRSRFRPIQYPNKRNNSYAENLEAPKSWTETDGRFLQTMKRLEEEERKREEQNNLWEKERLAMDCHS